MVEDVSPESSRELLATLTACRRCARLVQWREEVSRVKVRRFRDHQYWGKPVPGFGDLTAELVVVGLAPAAHGGNRTGRMFTGDDSGDWLIRALHQAGFANQPYSRSADDGLLLMNAYLTARVRCAPPANRPTKEEAQACEPYLAAELLALKPKVLVVLGQFAFDGIRQLVRRWGGNVAGWRFGHLAQFDARVCWGHVTVLCSYHPSRQNTSTGRLTQDMLTAVFVTAQQVLQKPTNGPD
jgi:uracil-DNA glycosylase family 4